MRGHDPAHSPCNFSHPRLLQDDLRYLEADENKNLDFLAGGGQPPRDGLEHFPQLWCPNGTYSAHGQVFLVPLSQVGGGGGLVLEALQ